MPVLTLIILLIAFFLSLPTTAEAKRVALVIGNGAYEQADALRNPPNDARAISATLRSSGFEVIEGVDLKHADMVRTIREFAARADAAELAVFFYAGHGLQVADRNYLLPVNASLSTESDLDFEAIPLALVIDNMERAAKRRIVFLDACRNNPFARRLARNMGTRGASVGAGLATVEAEVDSLYAFATQPGNVAEDGSGNNSPFTTAMLKHITTPGAEISDVLRRVRRDVLDATDGHQVPWDHSSLTEPVHFVAGTGDQAKAELPRWRGRPPVNACDRLAAHPHDPERTAEGVDMAFIDLAWAIPACAEAARLYPTERRFKFQHARTLHQSRQCERAKALYEELAADGHGLALNNIGLLYLSACGVKRNEAEAVRHYRLAVAAGSAFAKYSLGHMYEFGRGTAKNDVEAERLLREAAASGISEANIALASKYLAGRGVKRDADEALRLLKAAADAGSIDALGALGSIYAEGRGVPKDDTQAFHYFELAAQRGHPRAFVVMAEKLETGNGVEKDEKQAAIYYHKAVDAGSLQSMLKLAAMYATGRGVDKDPTAAERLYQLAVESDDGRVVGNIAAIYERGEGLAKNEAEAFRLYRRAVTLGQNKLRTRVARMMFAGRGTASNPAAAQRLYDEILTSASNEETFDVARLYASGREAPLKEAEALQLLRRLLAVRYAWAPVEVARMLQDGRGAPRDVEEAAQVLVEGLVASDPATRTNTGRALVAPVQTWRDDLRAAVKRRMKDVGLYDGPLNTEFGADFKIAVQRVMTTDRAQVGREAATTSPSPAAR